MEIFLKDKIVVITGAAAGLGKSIALAFAQERVKVVAIDIDGSKLAEVDKQLKTSRMENYVIRADLSVVEEINTAVGNILASFNRIDILVNNAGICPRTNLEDISEEEWDRVLAVNLKSAFFLSQRVLPVMKENRYGKIINMASGAGKTGGLQVGAHYSASKAGIICLTKTLARYAAPFGINVNAVCPGVIGTEMTNSASSSQIEKYKQSIPLGRIGQPGEVAAVVLFLASDAANYITGEIADVNGGFIMD